MLEGAANGMLLIGGALFGLASLLYLFCRYEDWRDARRVAREEDWP